MAQKNQYIANATFVATYAADRQIRFRLADVEKAFLQLVSGQASSTNVTDDAPPNIPRFTMQSGPKRIAISQVTAQLDLDFSEQHKSILNTLEIIKKNVRDFWTGVKELKGLENIKHVGLVVAINTPSEKNRNEICESILTRYTKFPKYGQFEDAAIRFGFLDDSECFYDNVAIGYYEVRSGTFQANIQPNSGPIEIDMDKLPILEVGYETKIDVNSRPMSARGDSPTKDVDDKILQNLIGFINSDGSEFLNW